MSYDTISEENLKTVNSDELAETKEYAVRYFDSVEDWTKTEQKRFIEAVDLIENRLAESEGESVSIPAVAVERVENFATLYQES